ncbi:tripartite tricarboxylate transporter substrate-binding protein [Nonomuraea sp. NBC_01738]|uniref:tripartite tricarboxylate transporter substrate-binding protein n=1 Tax=Nonomuraea sp. NBC_01738 TaxID=2976003 RepID=UPI002E11B733|nr:tripartite tricarboxylate transporter substrate-binding protein [Nonomuraea sp. NBC_01738]
MRRRRFFALGLGLAACAAGCATTSERTAGLLGPVNVVSGGEHWEAVAKALARTMRREGFPATGAAGLSSRATTVTVTGLQALASAQINGEPSLLQATTPLARITGEVEVVVVPPNSHFKDFDGFAARLLARPEETFLAGGPQGEADHVLFGLIAQGVGADTRMVDYTGYPGVDEAAAALLGGKAAAAAGRLSEWRRRLKDGRVRALAVSSAARVDGVEAPSLLESGVRVDFADWCAVVGPKDMSQERRAAAIRMCDELTGSPQWQAACRTGGWESIPLCGDDFRTWLGSEAERTGRVLRDLGLLDTPGTTCWGGCGNGH